LPFCSVLLAWAADSTTALDNVDAHSLLWRPITDYPTNFVGESSNKRFIRQVDSTISPTWCKAMQRIYNEHMLCSASVNG
jgi:hypothetical protein